MIERLGLAPDALAGETAVVTGGGQGIGREVALALAKLGARVVIAEIASTGGETERLIQAAGGKALHVLTDVSSESAVAALAERTNREYGSATILVNNAIVAPVARVVDLDVQTWDRTVAVNLRGAFLTCKAFLPGMLAGGRGTIINMVSTDAMHSMSAYIASKQGVVGLSQSLAAEVGGDGIRVIALAPGFVATPGLQAVALELAPRLGLTAPQFLDMPLHKGYAGAMPVADAGAATAYLIVALADELHGEVVTGYEVLERAGYLPGSGQSDRPNAPTAASTLTQAPDVSLTATALIACGRLQAVITQIEAEFGRLPIFVRPLARSGFKKKAGLSIPDWGLRLSDLATRLRALENGDRTAATDHTQWEPLLAGLSRYCRDLPEETGRFTRDEALLREVSRIAAERDRVIQDLAERLKRLG